MTDSWEPWFSPKPGPRFALLSSSRTCESLRSARMDSPYADEQFEAIHVETLSIRCLSLLCLDDAFGIPRHSCLVCAGLAENWQRAVHPDATFTWLQPAQHGRASSFLLDCRQADWGIVSDEPNRLPSRRLLRTTSARVQPCMEQAHVSQCTVTLK